MSDNLHDQVSYTRIRKYLEPIGRTIQVNESTLVDVAKDGRILGIETLSGHSVDWFAILADNRFGFRS